MARAMFVGLLISSGIFITCNSKNTNANIDAQANKNVNGKWFMKNNPKSYININETTYLEYVSEFDSEIKGKIHWIDSLNFELELTNVEGKMAEGMKTGKRYKFQIIELSPSQFIFNANNQLVTAYKNQIRRFKD